jgi:hypothetical protein
MKTNETSEIKNLLQDSPVQFQGISGIGGFENPGSRLRKIFYIASFVGLGICLNSCSATGYVDSEPAYVEYNRPPQPSNAHIWINGDWSYNQRNHIYVQKNGYWEKPNPRRTHVPGYWQSGPKGKYWVSGHYEKSHL